MLGPKTGYVDLLLEGITASLTKDAGKSTKYPLRPSAAGKCARELYFELMQHKGLATYPADIMAPEQHLLLNLGQSIEYHLLQQMRQHFKAFEVRYTQQVLNFGPLPVLDDNQLTRYLEGSLDLVLWSDTNRCIVDVKSKGDYYSFKDRKTAWDATTSKLGHMTSVKAISNRAYWVDDLPSFINELDDAFFAANFLQLNLYANSEFIKQRGIDHAAIIQYHKAKSFLREIRFKPSEALYEKTIAKFHNVQQAVAQGKMEMAPAEFEPETMKSRYCSFCKNKVPGSCATKQQSDKKV